MHGTRLTVLQVWYIIFTYLKFKICLLPFLQEMFIQSLAQVSLEQSDTRNQLKYNDLAEIVDNIDTLQFLQGITEVTLSFYM